MKTLYDILGVGMQASPAQIEQAYKSGLHSLGGDVKTMVETDLLKAKALKEAYSVLSIPSRRQAYDDKLKGRPQSSPHAAYQVVEQAPFPWIKAAIAALLLIGGFTYYKAQEHKAAMERAAAEATKAGAAAELAAKQVEVEQARLDQQRLAAQRQAEAQQKYEIERARTEGQLINTQNQAAEAKAARDKAQAEREKAQAERQKQLDQAREEQAARTHSQNDIAAMQRALNIPIHRH
jgi:curved DNA-binding protein CbpA